jgi:hypothetical protein
VSDEAPTEQVGAAPTVTENGGQLLITWPQGRGDSFVMRTSLFESMIADLNAAKRLAAALDQIKYTVEKLA